MRIIVLAFMTLITACSSLIPGTEERLQQYIGANISDVQALYLSERSRPISFWASRHYAWVEMKTLWEDGNTLHTFKNPYRDCSINWITDNSGVIQSATSSGTMCEP
ncbi:hypothetical protein ACFFUO_11345 [Vibrio artabrorum]|uniref:Lipoprotein n=1 Tax=Vibrio artabrorum TaxID=446374 RepID=A0ABT8CNQ3_9VIBR|nr:hypothetical protein [Vibrio artabrorum]MDN3702074.1 hypothetical protein [Vibrio artabrorum]